MWGLERAVDYNTSPEVWRVIMGLKAVSFATTMIKTDAQRMKLPAAIAA